MDFFDALTVVFPFAIVGRRVGKQQAVEGHEADFVPISEDKLDEAFKIVEEAMMDHVMTSKDRKKRK